jgi:hypothetical protein
MRCLGDAPKSAPSRGAAVCALQPAALSPPPRRMSMVFIDECGYGLQASSLCERRSCPQHRAGEKVRSFLLPWRRR